MGYQMIEDDADALRQQMIEDIEYKLCQQICEEVVERLNEENDVRVRSVCLQMLDLLIVSNQKLINEIEEQQSIDWNIWTQKDKDCAVNGDLYKDIGHLLSYSNINEVTIEESKPS